MLSLSQTTGYAIRALACLSEACCARQTTSQIARCSGVPRPYLAKIITTLARHGLLRARRGVRGGNALARPPEAISLLEVVEAIEGPDWLGPCLLGLAEECSDRPACPTRAFWQRAREEIRAELARTTLADYLRFQHARHPEADGPSRRREGLPQPAALTA
jgi:Rrf2 family protein